jgi:hypothetical protein
MSGGIAVETLAEPLDIRFCPKSLLGLTHSKDRTRHELAQVCRSTGDPVAEAALPGGTTPLCSLARFQLPRQHAALMTKSFRDMCLRVQPRSVSLKGWLT